jgi:hypothetical protein
VNLTAIRAVQAMVAPVVLITTDAILSGALLTMYGSVIAIGVAVTASSAVTGTTALALVLAGTVTLLGGLLFAARSIMISQDAIDYEVRRALSLGS